MFYECQQLVPLSFTPLRSGELV
jgi:hypothetical protein